MDGTSTNTGPTGPIGPTGSGGGGGGGIVTYYENSGSTITPSLNTFIRIIAGEYYNADPRSGHPTPAPNISVTVPSATASNDYLHIEFQYAQTSPAIAGVYLDVTLPGSTCNYVQSVNTETRYVWYSNATSGWSVIWYSATSNTFCN
jgi:hypothetical protein